MDSANSSRLVGFSVLVAAFSGAVAWALTGEALAGLITTAAVSYLALIVWRTSARATIGAAALLLLPPGVISEHSAQYPTAAMVVLILMLISVRPERKTISTTPVSVAFITLALAMVLLGASPIVPVLYIAGLIAALLIVNRPTISRQMLAALALLLAPLVGSYLVTMATGGFQGEPTILELGPRTIEAYPPFTLATSGPPVLLGTRRSALLVGEPGLVVFLLAPILALVLSSRSFRVKALGVGAVAAAAVISQSLATMLAVSAAVAVFAVTTLAVRYRRPVLAGFLGFGMAWFGLPLFRDVLTLKTTIAPESVGDRGLGGGQTSAASLGNINLVVTFSHDLPAALCIALALGAMALLARKSLVSLSAFVVFAITALIAQPSQWQVGAWVMLVAAFVIASPDLSEPPSAPYKPATRALRHPQAAASATLRSRPASVAT